MSRPFLMQIISWFYYSSSWFLLKQFLPSQTLCTEVICFVHISEKQFCLSPCLGIWINNICFHQPSFTLRQQANPPVLRLQLSWWRQNTTNKQGKRSCTFQECTIYLNDLQLSDFTSDSNSESRFTQWKLRETAQWKLSLKSLSCYLIRNIHPKMHSYHTAIFAITKAMLL